MDTPRDGGTGPVGEGIDIPNKPIRPELDSESKSESGVSNIFRFPGVEECSSRESSTEGSVKEVLERALSLGLDNVVIVGEKDGVSFFIGDNNLTLKQLAWLLIVYQNTLSTMMDGAFS